MKSFTVSLLASLSLFVSACGPELEGASSEEPLAGDEILQHEDALSASKTVTSGLCATTSNLVRSGTSLIASCSTRCRKDTTVTLRLRLNRISETGAPTLVGFNYLGASARVGGSTTVTAENMPAGVYEGSCEVDHSDKNRRHTFGTVVAGPSSF